MIRALTTGLLLLAALAAPGQTADAAASGWASEAHGAARLISRIEATGSGAEFEVGLLGTVVAAAVRAPILAVRVAGTGAPLRAPDLFVEGVQKGSPGRPDVLLADAGRVATFRIPIRGDSAAALAGTRLDLTLVDG